MSFIIDIMGLSLYLTVSEQLFKDPFHFVEDILSFPMMYDVLGLDIGKLFMLGIQHMAIIQNGRHSKNV